MAGSETVLDLTEILRDVPPGEWIALSPDHRRVISTAKTLEEAVRLARESGENQPIVFKLPPVGVLIV